MATKFPAAGNWPYALPFAALLAWAIVAQVRLYAHVPARRGPAAKEEPSVAGALARSPLGISVLGVVLMGLYFLVVGTAFGEPWLGTDAGAGAYGVGLMGVTVALYGWEIVFGAAARRARSRAMRHARGRTHRRDG
jgi:hypothetical protein